MINKNSKTYNIFPEFFEHPFIKSIANTPRWSVSNSNKIPIDIHEISKNNIRGCNISIPYSTNTLNNTIEIIEKKCNQPLKNHAFFMNVDEDKFIVLDIEPKCPSNLKRKFLEIPYIYAEKSLSGKGLHIVLPVPEEYYNYPHLAKLQKMKEKHGYYEIMFEHWITFTRNQIKMADKNNDEFFKDIFVKLANEQTIYENQKLEFELNYNKDEIVTDIKGTEDILEILLKPDANKFKKTSDDYHGDLSSYTFAICAHYYRVMDKIMNMKFIKEKHPDDYTPQERTRILYEAIKERVPQRDKNNEPRNGTTWLMEQCRNCVSLRLSEK